MKFTKKETYGFEDLVAIMELLRAPDGCPWDREQDHKSIRNNFIEETYEAIEAIDTDNKELLREELGDVLLQVVFHARISEEAGDFNIGDVTDEVCKKRYCRNLRKGVGKLGYDQKKPQEPDHSEAGHGQHLHLAPFTYPRG